MSQIQVETLKEITFSSLLTDNPELVVRVFHTPDDSFDDSFNYTAKLFYDVYKNKSPDTPLENRALELDRVIYGRGRTPSKALLSLIKKLSGEALVFYDPIFHGSRKITFGKYIFTDKNVKKFNFVSVPYQYAG